MVARRLRFPICSELIDAGQQFDDAQKPTDQRGQLHKAGDTVLTGALFFTFAFTTLVAILWAGFLLFRNEEDPLGDRLDELQAHVMVPTKRLPRRQGGGGVLNSFLFLVSVFPGGDDWLRIPMMSISHSDLMSIRSERSDAGLSQCETVIDIRQGVCLFSLS